MHIKDFSATSIVPQIGTIFETDRDFNLQVVFLKVGESRAGAFGIGIAVGEKAMDTPRNLMSGMTWDKWERSWDGLVKYGDGVYLKLIPKEKKPLTYAELNDGAVFSYKNVKGTPVPYYKPPRSQLMPVLVIGEKPRKGNPVNINCEVELHWDPQAYQKKMSGDLSYMECFQRFQEGMRYENHAFSDGLLWKVNKNPESRIILLNSCQVAVGREMWGLTLHNKIQESEESRVRSILVQLDDE